ncbi:MAG: ABC transporter substrate-binding protein [Bdellovibrionales bacterium]|nr:ABC transporter substrate-binding protein [Oligoflexia bacterium]
MFRAFKVLLILLIPMPCFAFERIVTLAPGLTEWTAAILGDAKAGSKIVGVSEYSLYPESMKKKVSVGPYPQLNIEKIASLKPDLVVASSEYNRPQQLEQLRRLKLPLVVVPLEDFNAMPEWILKLGRALQEEKAAAGQASEWTKELDALKKSKKGPLQRLFIEVQHQPLVTVGGPSFLTDAFSAIGYENVFRELSQGYPKVSKEAVLKASPDAIFILDLTGVKEDFERAQNDWQNFKTLKAVKNRQIRLIPGDEFARCSLRLLKALKALH